MKTRLVALLLALPLAAFDCGKEEEQRNPYGGACRLEIRGAVSEDLWCIVSAYDYSAMDPTYTQWTFELVAYRSMTEVGAGVGIFHTGPPALSSPYGWTATTLNVDGGDASRYVGDASVGFTETHRAVGIDGASTGSLSVTFTAIPPKGATGAEVTAVHGSLSAVVPATDGVGAPVTFAATF